ncbi:MAG TPA: PadR family transcriptional regulator [Thermoplasmata archaeon]|nr:PadR family transcriptional regulator [Thermoplasmata archaeon]
MPPRIIGLYSLAMMDREGPVYGYLVSRRIADRTGGSWVPGAGAVYPALTSLVERGLAERSVHGRRREFRITRKGRALLHRIRAEQRSDSPQVPDLSVLWGDISGTGDPGPLLLRRLRRTVDGLESYLTRESSETGDVRALRAQVLAELQLAEQRLRTARGPLTAAHRGRSGVP